MRIATPALMLLVLAAGCVSDRTPETEITVADVERILATLSADDMQGRKPFTPGIDRAAGFIADEFAEIGLETLDDLDGYLQEFPAFTLTPESSKVVLDGREIPTDRCIFMVNDRSIRWTTGSDVEIVSVMADDNAMQAFSAARGGQGNMLVVFDPVHARFFDRLQSYMSGSRFTMNLGEGGNSVFVVSNDTRVSSYDVEVTNTVTEQSLANVVGVIPGRRDDEIVLFGAHYDHIGILEPVEGDSIANGANDNATGTTAVVILAKYFERLPKPERTLVFVAFTAEETGGHGSRYVADHMDSDRVVAMVNFEVLGKPERDRQNAAWLTGYDKSDLGEIMRNAVDTAEYLFYPDPQPEQNLFRRSDNFTFARLGIPAHSVSTGLLTDDHDYHQVTDEIETLDVDHLARTIRAIAKAVMPIVSGEATPSRIDPAELN
jgi:hypothetical protein